jgi:hypothetical protein
MADFSIALEQLRGAYETSEGTATTPTRIISTGPPGAVDISGVLKRATIEDRRAAGTRTSLRGTYSGLETSDIVISNVPVSYQEVGWWLGLIAPTGAVAGGTVDTSAYTRTFTPAEGTAVNTFSTGYYTANLQYSSLDFASTLVYKMPAMRVTNLTFRWDKRGSGTDTGLMMDVALTMSKGTATQGTAFDGSLSHTTPTLALGNQVTSYIDAAYTATGTTTDAQIMSGQFSLDLPVTYHDGFDGTNGHTSAHYAQQWVPTMTLTRRFSDKTELTSYINKTVRAVRLQSVGDVVGASTATNLFRFDAMVSPTDHTVTQVDGLYYAELSYEAIYDATLTTSWSAYLQNNTAAAYSAT